MIPTSFNTRVRVCFVAGALIPAILSYGDDVRYAIITIEPIDGLFTRASDINDHGQVAGKSTFAPQSFEARATLWTQEMLFDLGTLDRCCSLSLGINDFGEVVGQSYTDVIGHNHAFIWRDGDMIDLGTIAGKMSYAWGVNNLSEVVGSSDYDLDTSTDHAALWRNGVIEDLGTLGGPFSVAWDINDSTQVVGDSDTAESGVRRGFFWQNGVMTEIGSFGGFDSNAREINESGTVVGSADMPFIGSQAYIWEDGIQYNIHNGADLDGSGANVINDLGEIVGKVYDPHLGGSYLAYWPSWSEPPVNLEDRLPPKHGWKFENVYAMNNNGQMAAVGEYPSGWERGLVFTPFTPEFTLSSVQPAIAGEDNGIRATGLDPGERVYFLYSERGGGTLVPGCDMLDAVLQIDTPTIIDWKPANAQGQATLVFHVPPGARNRGEILFQAVAPQSCRASNLVVAEFE